jgi:hypothetical protein
MLPYEFEGLNFRVHSPGSPHGCTELLYLDRFRQFSSDKEMSLAVSQMLNNKVVSFFSCFGREPKKLYHLDVKKMIQLPSFIALTGCGISLVLCMKKR